MTLPNDEDYNLHFDSRSLRAPGGWGVRDNVLRKSLARADTGCAVR